MSRMTAVGGEILWVSVGLVCRSVWITDVPLEDDCGVQEGDTFGGVLTNLMVVWTLFIFSRKISNASWPCCQIANTSSI